MKWATIGQALGVLAARGIGNAHGLGPSLSYHADDDLWYMCVWIPMRADGEDYIQTTGNTVREAVERSLEATS